MVSLAVIPARGGSKRIPKKNIRIFNGKPMIAYSIEAAKSSGVFDRIVVSTDDEEIAVIAKEYGAEVPFVRPEHLSNDFAATTEVIAHCTQFYIDRGETPTEVCCIYATAPLVLPDDLRRGYEIIKTNEWQYVFSATSFGFPIFRSIKTKEDGSVEMFYPEHFKTRSQDLPEAYHDAGQFYWGKPEAWLEGKQIFDKWSTIVLLPRWRVQDIDTMEDWERAEMLYNAINNQKYKDSLNGKL
ncbi:pseudaminic acid cytidylyltransferase [Leptospira kanakyensis]|uniref:pseudaminic acid cytidylyltransferase n=1 Tax=Leptospira kanakyensis TaxID=2484968 RepID=UPI00223D38FD|nr:pseudaminic acid cytidylyltransferase [Leptospira kanakyensis]MCW7471404.1 pseudaminic acid cytidylyltransferase [Leptospira kanakyensis]